MCYKRWRIYKKESCGIDMSENKFVELVYKDVDENENYKKIIDLVVNKCFEVEKLEKLNLYI